MYVTPKPPKGGTKRDFAVIASKIQLLSKKVCCKVSLCENFRNQSWATSFLYLTVHRSIAGDVRIYLNLRWKWPTPSENADFDKFRLIVTHPWELARK